MTLITFANVVARYVFNSNILWALEGTVFLFAWLVLLGASYAVKIGAHIAKKSGRLLNQFPMKTTDHETFLASNNIYRILAESFGSLL